MTVYHVLKLFHSTDATDAIAANLPVYCENYEEIVFQDPTVVMRNLLVAKITPYVSGEWKHHTNCKYIQRFVWNHLFRIRNHADHTNVFQLKWKKCKLSRNFRKQKKLFKVKLKTRKRNWNWLKKRLANSKMQSWEAGKLHPPRLTWSRYVILEVDDSTLDSSFKSSLYLLLRFYVVISVMEFAVWKTAIPMWTISITSAYLKFVLFLN